jgi:hypothetical protein
MYNSISATSVELPGTKKATNDNINELATNSTIKNNRELCKCCKP